MIVLAVAVIVFGVLAIGCGWALLAASPARWTGGALVVGGSLLLGGVGLDSLGISGQPLYIASVALDRKSVV